MEWRTNISIVHTTANSGCNTRFDQNNYSSVGVRSCTI